MFLEASLSPKQSVSDATRCNRNLQFGQEENPAGSFSSSILGTGERGSFVQGISTSSVSQSGIFAPLLSEMQNDSADITVTSSLPQTQVSALNSMFLPSTLGASNMPIFNSDAALHAYQKHFRALQESSHSSFPLHLFRGSAVPSSNQLSAYLAATKAMSKQ